jgi:thiol-disulfide isomerase/thioredoxin
MSRYHTLFLPVLFFLAMIFAAGIAGCGQNGSSSPTATEGSAQGASSIAARRDHTAFSVTASGMDIADDTTVKLVRHDLNPDGSIQPKDLASATVHDGGFTLTGHVSRPAQAVLLIGKNTRIRMIIEDADYKLVKAGASLAIKGGRYNDAVYGYERLPSYISAKKAWKKARKKAMKDVDMNDQAAYIAALGPVTPYAKKMQQIIDDYQADILNGDAPAQVKLFVLADNNDRKRFPISARQTMLTHLAKQLGDDPLLTSMQEYLKIDARSEAARAAVAKGKHYADLTVADKDGHKVKLSDVLAKNKLVLLDFWASWCSPCRAEFPSLAEAYNKYHADGFEIYAVSLDEEPADWLKALKQERAKGDIPWINLRASGFDSDAAKSYGVLGLPSSYLIAADGTVVDVMVGNADVTAAVHKQIAKMKLGGR